MSKRRLRPEIRNLIDKIEMTACLAFFIYAGIRCFLFAVGIDL